MNTLYKITFILFIVKNAYSLELVLLTNPKSQAKLEADISALSGRIFRYADEMINYKGVILFNDQVIPLKFKIHGDLHSHWKSSNKSYSIKLDKGYSIMGIRNFSLIRFSDKYGNYEVFGQYISKQLGLLHRKIQSVRLKVNYFAPAHYLIYEHITPDALEHNGIAGSFIISHNNVWKTAISKKVSKVSLPYTSKKITDNEITLSSTTYKIRPKINSSKINLKWKKFLQQPSFLFLNKKDFYSYLTIIALTGSVHSVLPDNLRWNYRPWRGNFSPIYYDTIPRRTKMNINDFISELSRMNYLLRMIFKHVNKRELAIAINRNLESLSSQKFNHYINYSFSKELKDVEPDILKLNMITIKKWLDEEKSP